MGMCSTVFARCSMVMCYLWSVVCCMDPNQFAPNMYDVQSSAAAQWVGVVVTLYMYWGDAWPKSQPSHWLCWVKFSCFSPVWSGKCWYSTSTRKQLVPYDDVQSHIPLQSSIESHKSLSSYSVCFLIYWQFFPSHLMSHSTCLNCPVLIVTCFNL